MIDQNAGNLVIVDEVQHCLSLFCFDGLSEFEGLEVDVYQFVKLLPSAILDAKLAPQGRVEAVAEYHILESANDFRPTISQQILIILFLNAGDMLP